MTRETTLTKALLVTFGDRDTQYGDPENNFKKIASLWSAYLDKRIDPCDVVAMMILLKTARISSGVQKNDNWVDIAGYAACGAEMQTTEDDQ